MGLLSWVINEDTASIVRWLYQEADTRDPMSLTLRGLATELVKRGVLSPTGLPRWTVKQVSNILRNPKYCGLGKGLRYETVHTLVRDPETQKVHDVRREHDRMKDPERWANEAIPYAPGVIPPIISEDQWRRVQTKLDQAATLNRYRARRHDMPAQSLLDGGFIFCAECGGRMHRFWAHQGADLAYRCQLVNATAGLSHRAQTVPAQKTEALVLRLLAHALTDPEKVVSLADAAAADAEAATVDAALAQSAVLAAQQRLEALTSQERELQTALAALMRVSGVESQVAAIQERLSHLHAERADAQRELTLAAPVQVRAQERAEVLRSLFARRNWIINLATGAVTEEVLAGLELHSEMSLYDAATLLGLTEAEVRGLPTVHGETADHDPVHPGTYVEVVEAVDTEEVIFALLNRAPHEAVRTLMRDLDARVMVAPGRTRADILARKGHVPLAQRIELHLLRSQPRVLRLGTHDDNVIRLSHRTNAMVKVLLDRL